MCIKKVLVFLFLKVIIIIIIIIIITSCFTLRMELQFMTYFVCDFALKLFISLSRSVR